MLEEPELARISTGFPFGTLSVSELARSVRDVLEHRFPLLRVRGEMANCTVARSGHVYFVLKDASAQVRCVMFRSRAQLLDWTPCDGTQVEVQALVSFYEPRGEFQLAVENMSRGGRGALFEAFLRLKDKLEAEGLFDAAIKRPLPFLPRRIGIVTSPQAAALRDVLTTLARRNPSIPVCIYPTPVQGDTAGGAIGRALSRAGARSECDVIILCRGGGGIEDLWPFNEESVARAIRACPIPVVTGIGHETDFTIADFAADRRAPTPTGAAEMASPARDQLLGTLGALATRLAQCAQRDLDTRSQTVDMLARRLVHPARRLREREEAVQRLKVSLSRAGARALEDAAWRSAGLAQRLRTSRPRYAELAALVRHQVARMSVANASLHRHCAARFESLHASLHLLSPERVLARGYSLVRDGAGHVVVDAARIHPGDTLRIAFGRGSASALVQDVQTEAFPR